MSYSYQFHEAAQLEYEESLLWYLLGSEKLLTISLLHLMKRFL